MLTPRVHLRPQYYCSATAKEARITLRRETLPELSADAILLFSCMRNERRRVEQFLRHYEILGVDYFFVVDNGSTDGTLNILESHPKVVLYSTDQRYGEAGCGHIWIERLLSEVGIHHWCVVADADEFLIYPGYPEVSLAGLTRYLESGNYSALPALLADMHGENLYESGNSNGDPFELCPYIDTTGYRTHRKFLLNRRQNWITGGFRERVFDLSVCLNKIPLFKMMPHTRLSQGAHFILGNRVADIRGLQLHFKFLSDFDLKAFEESQRREQYNEAADYIRYAEVIRRAGSPRVKIDQSVRWDDTQSLLTSGLMKSSARYERWRSQPR